MQVGFAVATVAMAFMAMLSPETPYIYEAIVMVVLGLGLGVAMPVLTLAVQNEFEQKELGVATSANQLFRSLGSTVGTAVFGALLTAGILAQAGAMQQTEYVQALSNNSQVARIGTLDDPNTLLTLNTPDIKTEITKAATEQFAELPEAAREQATASFTDKQQVFSDKVTHAFSDSLRTIFIVATVMIGVATVLVFFLKERKLKAGPPNATPGEM